MKVFALIPARLNSKRLPKKLMLDLGGMPIINRTYFNVLETKLFDKVVVVTNSKLIYNSYQLHVHFTKFWFYIVINILPNIVYEIS